MFSLVTQMICRPANEIFQIFKKKKPNVNFEFYNSLVGFVCVGARQVLPGEN